MLIPTDARLSFRPTPNGLIPTSYQVWSSGSGEIADKPEREDVSFSSESMFAFDISLDNSSIVSASAVGHKSSHRNASCVVITKKLVTFTGKPQVKEYVNSVKNVLKQIGPNRNRSYLEHLRNFGTHFATSVKLGGVWANVKERHSTRHFIAAEFREFKGRKSTFVKTLLSFGDETLASKVNITPAVTSGNSDTLKRVDWDYGKLTVVDTPGVESSHPIKFVLDNFAAGRYEEGTNLNYAKSQATVVVIIRAPTNRTSKQKDVNDESFVSPKKYAADWSAVEMRPMYDVIKRYPGKINCSFVVNVPADFFKEEKAVVEEMRKLCPESFVFTSCDGTSEDSRSHFKKTKSKKRSKGSSMADTTPATTTSTTADTAGAAAEGSNKTKAGKSSNSGRPRNRKGLSNARKAEAVRPTSAPLVVVASSSLNPEAPEFRINPESISICAAASTSSSSAPSAYTPEVKRVANPSSLKTTASGRLRSCISNNKQLPHDSSSIDLAVSPKNTDHPERSPLQAGRSSRKSEPSHRNRHHLQRRTPPLSDLNTSNKQNLDLASKLAAQLKTGTYECM
ncbi:hypothetical protein HDU82_003921, partial [Entophlyctis luteolus]